MKPKYLFNYSGLLSMRMMKASNTVRSAAIVSVLGLSAMLSVPQAYAEDQKVYPGSACDAYFASHNAYLNRAFGGGIFAGPSDAFVHCPIVRDNVSNLNGTKGAIVRVYNNRTDALAVSCYLVAADPVGNYIADKGAQATTIGTVNLNVDINASADQGVYHLYCYLPANSGVLSYSINEY